MLLLSVTTTVPSCSGGAQRRRRTPCLRESLAVLLCCLSLLLRHHLRKKNAWKRVAMCDPAGLGFHMGIVVRLGGGRGATHSESEPRHNQVADSEKPLLLYGLLALRVGAIRAWHSGELNASCPGACTLNLRQDGSPQPNHGKSTENKRPRSVSAPESRVPRHLRQPFVA